MRYGLICGTKNFFNLIKSTYLSRESDAELPQLRQIRNDSDPNDLLKQAASTLGCDIVISKQAPRITKKHIQVRDILLYFMWETGLYTKRQTGNLFGFTYSTVSRRANFMRSKIAENEELRRKYEKIKSLIKT